MEGVGKWLWMLTIFAIWFQVYGCLEQEKSALLQLKQHLGNQLHFKLQSEWLAFIPSWKDGKTRNCCDDWEGVTCGPNYRVVSLSLILVDYPIDYSVEMHFNASILLPFVELRELNLTRTNIITWAEDEAAPKLSSRLKSLELLNLQGNRFDVNGLSQFHGYSTLKYLFLGSNHLEGLVQLHDIEAISQNVEELSLANNQITDFLNHNGSSKLSTSIKVLDLSDNKLDNNIISQLSGFQSLRTLHLQHNQLRGMAPLYALHQLKNLEELDLSYNSITSITNYNDSTKFSSKLKVLVLSWNKLDNIISQLIGFQSLHILNLGTNQMRGNISIKDLRQLRNLEVLDLSYNEITGFTNYKDSSYSGLTSLKILDVSHNRLAGDIPSCLRNFISLETLDLSYNHMIGNIGSSPLIHLHSLKDLRLSYNHLQIPYSFQSFSNHTKLKYFFGDSNHVFLDDVSKHDAQSPFNLPLGLQLQVLSLSDCELFAYPPFLPHQRDLVFVDLSDNSLQQEFPIWLFENNLRLDTLILSNNSFIGSLQLPSRTHAYVSRIWVAQNKIQGHIPANISVVFPNLIDLDLSNNEFKGNIPSSIVDLKSLEALDLSNNHLSGKINHLSKSLKSLDLSNNEFNGELPPTEGLLSLEFLNLQGNNYSSGLQMMNKFAPSLQIINLSNNSLEGPIPKDIYNSSMLWVLDLSFNKLRGPLPIFFSIQINILNLNNNRLSGHVPDAFCAATFYMEILNLSNNELEGHIPNEIGNIPTLKVLLLRGNKFHGQVPLQLCNLVDVNILDLSNNNLNGSIPACLSQIATTLVGIIISSSVRIDLAPGRIKRGSVGNMINMKLDSYHNNFDSKVEFVTKNMAYIYEGNILRYMAGIDLSCNNLSGQIPHQLGNLSNIHALNLSHNKLWGAFPSAFSKLKNIESLDLSYNQLDGRIPAEVTNLNTLGVFKVNYNNLSGRIPFEAHSTTFDATNYEGNPFLCGPPLSINCTTGESPSTGRSESRDNEDGDGWIDMETFYVTFAVSGVTMFLAVVIIMLINPYWWNVWYYLVKTCIFTSYYFFEDSIRMLRRARQSKSLCII